MPSVRKDIINNVITQLKAITSPRIGKVSEKPGDFARLARTAYPFVQVNVESENKEDIAMEWRLSTLELGITVHIEGKSKTEKAEEQLSDIIEAIEEKLEADRKRDSKAQTTEILEVGEMVVSSYPTLSQRILVGIQYTYSRGNT
tara:strand:+ start:274 stop:708 length:435 start_codon:yes stop_codon:yes gene_type:complete